MNLPIRYAAFLSLLLIVMFVVINPSFEGAQNITRNEIPNPIKMNSTLRAFSLSSLLFIPLVIATLIMHVSQLTGPGFTWKTGFRSGEIVSRWAATFFTFAVVLYSLGFYSGLLYPIGSAIPMALYGGVTAFVGTYLVGLISAALVAIVVRKIRSDAIA